MTIMNYSWENNLISMAVAALESGIGENRSQQVTSESLNHAYRYCDEITQINSRTFYAASALLQRDKREAVRALYAFCRISDDLVDCSDEVNGLSVQEWHQPRDEEHTAERNEVLLAWDDTRAKYNIPWKYVEQLIDGLLRDQDQKQYQTFAELTEYCYGVACTVGLMAMQIIGYSSEKAIPYAIRLGVALQMTNILRDVGEDFRIGRVYLPQEELLEFNLTIEDLEQQTVSDRWRDFMRFQIERVRKLYADSLPGVAYLNVDGRLAIQAAGELYREILKDIEDHDYNVFSHRASVSQWKKLRMLPGIWWHARSGQRPA